MRPSRAAIAAGKLAVRLINHLVYNTEPEFDFVHELEEKVIRVAERLAYGPSTGAVVAEAERRGIPVLRLDPRRSLVQLGHGAYQKSVWATVTSATAARPRMARGAGTPKDSRDSSPGSISAEPAAGPSARAAFSKVPRIRRASAMTCCFRDMLPPLSPVPDDERDTPFCERGDCFRWIQPDGFREHEHSIPGCGKPRGADRATKATAKDNSVEVGTPPRLG